MWVKLSSIILKNRLALLIITVLVTIFMAYKAKDIEMTYDFVKVVPENDPDFLYFKDFKKTFGEDGNIMVIGIQDRSVFKDPVKFKEYQQLTAKIAKVEGVNEVVSLPTMKRLVKDTSEQKFVLEALFKSEVSSKKELDSLLQLAKDTKFYEGLIWNEKTSALLIAVTIEREYLNSARRVEVVNNILTLSNQFSNQYNVKAHYAGLPYVRAIMMGQVQGELKLFLALAILVTSIILFFFFRSFFAVFFTFFVISILVIWTLGTIALLGYKVTLLTGILPALIIVISIPNCIYMYNKYHQEYKRHGNKIKGVSRIIQKVGFLTFMTNANTAVGFFVLYFTDIAILEEFGMVAGIISIATFFITLVVIPALLLYLPDPSEKQLMHLDFILLKKINLLLEYIVIRHRAMIYILTIIMLGFSVYGIYKIRAVSYMVDDLPESSNVKTDLGFFEKNFNGVMPLEIIVDLGKKNAVMKTSSLEKIQEFDEYLRTVDHVSPPLSILNIVKALRQAFYNGDPEYYSLPSTREYPFLKKYTPKGSGSDGLVKSFIDSTQQKVRITAKVADLGTTRMNELVTQINSKAQEIFKGTDIKVTTTGTTLLFLKGNQYLINDLTQSLVFAFILISIMMALIFANLKMILISLVPNIIPMLLTAGIMGIFNIPLKPSTALIFSISFGISIDSTIHYLAKFKQDLFKFNGNVLQAVTHSLEESGVSIIYTSIVLFCGFIIFAWSDFGGTIALGVLTSLTLFFSMFTNLLILPSLLITFSKGNKKNLFPIVKDKSKNRFYEEDEDEEIQIERISINKTKDNNHLEE
jgi:predicted RND superfamily exporter protein